MRRFMWVFVLPVMVCADRPKLKDLKEFLDTNQKVWLLRTSKPSYTGKYKHVCTAFQVLEKKGNDYKLSEFYEYFMYLEYFTSYARISMVQQGNRKTPVMVVGKEKGGPGVRYTLRTWDPTDRCAVRTYNESGNTECQLYAWDEAVGKKKMSKCKKIYNKQCPRSNYRVFTLRRCT